MGPQDDTYSRYVGVLKVILPLAALALMSTVFLFARAPATDSEIPYAEIEAIAQEPRLSGAQVTGVANDGSVIELTARTTIPDGRVIRAEMLEAGIDTVDGVRIDLRAGSAEIDRVDRTTRLSGLTRVETSNGFEMETNGLTAELTTGRIVSDGALEVQAPFGALSAGQLVIDTPEEGGGQVMLFQNGVRLVYTPQQ